MQIDGAGGAVGGADRWGRRSSGGRQIDEAGGAVGGGGCR